MGPKPMQVTGVRIVVDKLGTLGNVHVYDAASGQELTGIGAISIHIPIDGPTRASFSVLVDSIDIAAEVDITTIDIRTHEEIARGIRLDDK